MTKPVAQGRRIGFDYGEKRIGVATSDAASILVSPHATIINDQQGYWVYKSCDYIIIK